MGALHNIIKYCLSNVSNNIYFFFNLAVGPTTFQNAPLLRQNNRTLFFPPSEMRRWQCKNRAPPLPSSETRRWRDKKTRPPRPPSVMQRWQYIKPAPPNFLLQKWGVGKTKNVPPPPHPPSEMRRWQSKNRPTLPPLKMRRW